MKEKICFFFLWQLTIWTKFYMKSFHVLQIVMFYLNLMKFNHKHRKSECADLLSKNDQFRKISYFDPNQKILYLIFWHCEMNQLNWINFNLKLQSSAGKPSITSLLNCPSDTRFMSRWKINFVGFSILELITCEAKLNSLYYIVLFCSRPSMLWQMSQR